MRGSSLRREVQAAAAARDPARLARVADGLRGSRKPGDRFIRAVALRELHQCSGDAAALDEACAVAESIAPRGVRYRLAWATVLFTRADVRGDRADVDRVIDLLRGALVERLDAVELATGLMTLCCAYYARFERASAEADLDASVEVGWAAVRAAGDNAGLAASCLTNLVNPLRARGERRADRQDLDTAVEVARRVARAGASAQAWSNLGTALLARHGLTRDPADLDDAVAALRSAADGTGPFRPSAVANLVSTLVTRADDTGDARDLAEALDLARSVAVDPGTRAALAMALAESSERHHRPDLADEAIDLFRAVLAETGPDDLWRAGGLANLSTLLSTRHRHSGARADLDDAIATAEQAIARTPPSHAHYRHLRGSVALDRHRRWLSTGDERDRIAALEHSRASIDGVDPGDPAAVSLLVNYAGLFGEAEPDRAIEILGAVNVRGPNAAVPLTALANALLTRYGRTEDPADRTAAAAAADRAITATEPDHPLLGQSLLLRSAASADGEEARAFAERAAALDVAPPGVRAAAARRASGEAAALGDWAGAARALRMVVDLLDRTVPAELDRVDATTRLTPYAGLAVDAVATAVLAGDLEGAVEVWHRARAVLLGRALSRGRDLARLRRVDPALADRLAALSRELDTVDYYESAGDVVERRRAAVRERESVLAEIHSRQGDLLRTPREPLPAADEGPLVLLNVSTLRSDALVLRHSGIELVPLPDARAEQVAEWVTGLLAGDRDDEWLFGLLAWLWDAIAAPVLAVTGTDRPIRWSPSGFLAFLPLHAAGHRGGESVLDQVDSSYRVMPVTSRARTRRPWSAAVVTMPVTGGAAELPAAMDSETWLRAHFGAAEFVADGVVAALGRHPWAHFACHAHSDLADPWASALIADEPLPVSVLAGVRLPDAELAFLAACSTSRPGTALPDEAVHLASVFQLLGYRHVIATLWPVPDRIAHRVTRLVYRDMGEDSDLAAGAVRRAAVRVRELLPDKPWCWAGYVHYG
ncbi:CHAT domain-containing protein [Actinokineospora auranticolor]|uniref:CHAT domain-containing protein n=1 Tax=Actinokineospora auranticolor TaxID=155976 RepID=A0A2S6GSU8_9PSEU|nr:CHAT domain-containing protein [Actinokineospora auranticolor]PPK68322.1 CHAT domain-containing protein [Actinokineospora auranticolor]